MNKKSIMIVFIVLLSIAIVNAQEEDVVLSLTLKYDGGKITKESIKLIEGVPPDRLNQPTDGYTAKVISFNNEELYSFKFLIELTPLTALDPTWFDDEGNQIFFPDETMKPLEELVFVLNFPYFKNGKSIKIYNPNNKLVLIIDISEFATCNRNNVCDLKESHELCPEDCPLSEEKSRLSLWEKIINFIKSLFK